MLIDTPCFHRFAGNQWFHCCAEGFAYGMRCHIGVDAASGLVHSVMSEFRIAMKPGQRRVLPDTAEGRLLDLVEMAEAHFRTKVEHPFRIVKCQFGFKKVYYRGTLKNDLKLLFALGNLWMLRARIPDLA